VSDTNQPTNHDATNEPIWPLKSVRPEADHLPMGTTLQLLTWAGVIAAAAVLAALVVVLL
jgi:hypothetical protein